MTKGKRSAHRACSVFVLISGLWVVDTGAQTSRYEVSVSWGSSSSLMTSSYEVTVGKAIEVPVGDEFVSIVALPLSDGEYDLQITQLSKEPDTRLPTAVFTRRESFGTRSELRDVASGVSVQNGRQ